ncbi:MAG: hypothetical protein R2706_07330 [Acidimicrobiales bacterium]
MRPVTNEIATMTVTDKAVTDKAVTDKAAAVAAKTEAAMATEVARSRGVAPNWRVLLAVVLATLLVFELGARFVVSQSSFEADLLPRILEEHRTNLDQRADAGVDTSLLFLGTSNTGAGFDPSMVSDGSAYDLWWAGSDAMVMEHLAADFADNLVEPDTVVIGITSRELNDARIPALAATFDQASSTLAWRRVANPDWLTKVEVATSKVSNLVKYRTFLRRPSAWFSWVTGSGPAEEGLTTGEFGQLTRYRDGELAMTEADIARETEALANYRVGGGEIDALQRLLESFGDARVVLVFLPVSESTYVPLHPNGAADVGRPNVRRPRQVSGLE